jgi:hypothetical protein
MQHSAYADCPSLISGARPALDALADSLGAARPGSALVSCDAVDASDSAWQCVVAYADGGKACERDAISAAGPLLFAQTPPAVAPTPSGEVVP